MIFLVDVGFYTIFLGENNFTLKTYNTTALPGTQQYTMEEPQPAPTRWEVELEFVQALANLQYLNFLAQNKYLEKEEFLNYLKYLEYWREPQYAKHLVYPNCLHVLTLLQSAHFREQILRQDTAAVLMNDMVNRWKEPQTMFAATPISEKKTGDVASVPETKADEEAGDEAGVQHNGTAETAVPSIVVNGNDSSGSTSNDVSTAEPQSTEAMQ